MQTSTMNESFEMIKTYWSADYFIISYDVDIFISKPSQSCVLFHRNTFLTIFRQYSFSFQLQTSEILITPHSVNKHNVLHIK